MNHVDEYDFVASEITTLKTLLATIPPEDVIDRMSLESRLTQAQSELATLPKPVRLPTVCLTFRGKAVAGSRSISADFGAKALDAFSEVFTAVTAGTTTDLSSRGPIPDKDKNQLRIVGTAVGSFGFELELPQDTTESCPATAPDDTLRKIETLLTALATGNDDEVTDIVADLPQRTVSLLNKFLDVLVKNESWCGLSYGNKKFYYENFEQVKESANRLADSNVHNDVVALQGKFKGFFPIERKFEFLPAEETDRKGAIHGKIDIAIEEPDVLNREWLEKPVAVTFHTMQIGRGKPRFTLKSLDALALR